jgi:hypothetical protein
MVKSFKMWFEERENIKNLKSIFLRRLGLESNVLDDGQDFKLKSFSKEKLKDVVTKIGLDDDIANNLVSWIEMSYDTSSLSALISRIKESDLDTEDMPDEGLPTQPAQLPSGSSNPPSQMPPQQNLGM